MNVTNDKDKAVPSIKPHAQVTGPDITDMIEKSGCSAPYYALEGNAYRN